MVEIGIAEFGKEKQEALSGSFHSGGGGYVVALTRRGRLDRQGDRGEGCELGQERFGIEVDFHDTTRFGRAAQRQQRLYSTESRTRGLNRRLSRPHTLIKVTPHYIPGLSMVSQQPIYTTRSTPWPPPAHPQTGIAPS
jgi:hypothetical protein